MRGRASNYLRRRMTYTVTRRDKNGYAISETFEAGSRTELFALLKERGIVAIRISEGSVKNKPKSRFHINKVYLLFASLALIAVCLFVFVSESQPNELKKTAPVKEIKKEKPKVVPVRNTPPQAPIVKPKRFWEVDASQTNGFTEMQMRKWRIAHRPPPGYTNNAAKIRKKPSYAIFKHKCENLIAAYITMPPGEGMIGTPMLGKRFEKEFMESLKDKIEISKDDTPEMIQLKQDMIATKADLKARIDAGENLTQIIRDTHDEIQSLSRYKQMLQKEIAKVKKDSSMTLQDVELFVEAANKMLEEKGIAPIKLGPVSKRMILRRQGL